MGNTRVCLTGTVLGVLLLGPACGSGDDQPAAEATSTTHMTPTPAVTEDVDIGDGRTLHLRCGGEGSPTVVLEAGDEGGVNNWIPVAIQLEKETRTCAYDRLGNGHSSEATGCRGLDDVIGDLEKLLEVANIKGPYIFVGASGGGSLAAEMAVRHADETEYDFENGGGDPNLKQWAMIVGSFAKQVFLKFGEPFLRMLFEDSDDIRACASYCPNCCQMHFRCPREECGHTNPMSPADLASDIRCAGCGVRYW